jgi:hypothetical protein
MDGAYGWVPDYTACRENGIPFVTRLTRPEMFRQSDVRDVLLRAVWEYVPDSGTGPKRSATELGYVTLNAADGVTRSDGTLYTPIEVRVVVSRFEREKDAQRGVVIENWQYEFFAIDALPAAWPAADAVAAYFGRAAQENRFAQEDREMVLDRIYSYNLAGQEFATMVGLAVWNYRIALGYRLNEPPPNLPPQKPHRTMEDPRPVPPETELLTTEAGKVGSEPGEGPGIHAADHSLESQAPADGPPSEAPLSAVNRNEVRRRIIRVLGTLNWKKLMSRRPGWQWLPASGEVKCADGQLLSISFVDLEHAPAGRARLHFVGRRGACDECPDRPACFPSTKSRPGKMISITVSHEPAKEIHELLSQLPSYLRMKPAAVPRPKSAKPAQRGGIPIRPQIGNGPARRLRIAVAGFLPASARHAFSNIARGLSTQVRVLRGRKRRTSHPFVARTDRERAHGRLTWEQQVARYALPSDTELEVTHSGSDALVPILGGTYPKKRRDNAGK